MVGPYPPFRKPSLEQYTVPFAPLVTEPDYKVSPPLSDFTPLYPTLPYLGVQAQENPLPTGHTTPLQGECSTIRFNHFVFTYKYLGSDRLRAQKKFDMSNDNVHLMIENMDTIRNDMFELLGQFRFESGTNIELYWMILSGLGLKQMGSKKRHI